MGFVRQSPSTFALATAPFAVAITACAPGIVRSSRKRERAVLRSEPHDRPAFPIAEVGDSIDTGDVVIASMPKARGLELRDRAGRPRPLRLNLGDATLQPSCKSGWR